MMTAERLEWSEKAMASKPILDVRNLQTTFFTEKETIRAVDGISFDVFTGETVGLVGESGSGKTVTARSLMGLVDRPGRVLRGSSIRFQQRSTVREFTERYPKRTVDVESIHADHPDAVDRLFEDDRFDVTARTFGHRDRSAVSLVDVLAAGYGDELGLLDGNEFVFVTERSNGDVTSGFIEVTRLSGEPLRSMRGGRIAMIFQDPLTSLNPVYTVGNQIKEALRIHRGIKGKKATDEAAELLEAVGIPDARRRIKEYPHQFSGGMQQRAIIAMALACDPDVLICDEPTTALDVTIQAQILELLADIQEREDLSILFITHDMGVIANVADRVNVMYAGEIVESAGIGTLFETPKHPYTEGLLRSIPGKQTGDRLETIAGTVPTPNEPASYCRFAPRCPRAFDECRVVHPSPVPPSGDEDGHSVSCLLYPETLSRWDAVAYHDDRQEGSEAKTVERTSEVDE